MDVAQRALTPEERENVSRQLLEAMVSALEDGQATDADAADAADFILTNLDSISNTNELMEFLQRAATKWEVFTSVFQDVKKEELLSKVNNELHQYQ